VNNKGLWHLLQQPIVFGLRAQNKLEIVDRMLKDGRTWEEIGSAIGWEAATAQRYWEMERFQSTDQVSRGDVRRAIKEAHYKASVYARQTGARRDKRREDKLWSILKEMERDD